MCLYLFGSVGVFCVVVCGFDVCVVGRCFW